MMLKLKTSLKVLVGAFVFLGLTACNSRSNTKPVINIDLNDRSEITVTEQKLITLNAMASDADGTIAQYLWTQINGTTVKLINADSNHLSFTAPNVTTDEALTFSLTVTDNEGASQSVNVIVMVFNDKDNDGVPDNEDTFPDDATETVDTDGDGIGNNKDTFPDDATEAVDTDGDGVGDNKDAFPGDATETVDADGDGVGDNTIPVASTSTTYDELLTDLDPRELSFTGSFDNLASQVNLDSVKIKLNGVYQNIVFDNLKSYSWAFTLTGIKDDKYALELEYQDNIGNFGTPLSMPFAVNSKKIDLTVNGVTADIVGFDSNIEFKAAMSNVNPSIKSYTWLMYSGDLLVDKKTTTVNRCTWSYGSEITDGKIVVVADDKYSPDVDISQVTDEANFIVTDVGTVSLLFRNSATDTINIAMGEKVNFEIYSVYLTGPIGSFDWDLNGDGTYEKIDGGLTQSVTFNTAGQFNVSAKANADDGNSGNRTITINVDPDSSKTSVKDK